MFRREQPESAGAAMLNVTTENIITHRLQSSSILQHQQSQHVRSQQYILPTGLISTKTIRLFKIDSAINCGQPL